MPSKSGGDSCDLLVAEADASRKHVYAGSVSGPPPGQTACVLAFDPDRQSFVLDVLDTEFRFNVTSTPGNQSAKALATAHPQLEMATSEAMSGDDDLFDEDSTSEGDPENPYDYRHYLKRLSSSPDPMDSLEPLDAISRRPSPLRQPQSQPQSQPSTAATKDSRNAKTRPPRPLPSPQDETDADNEDSSDDGSLEIVLDGAKSTPFQGQYAAFGSRGNSGSPAKTDEHASESDQEADHHSSPAGQQDQDLAHDEDDDEDYDAMAEAIEAELEKQERETNHAVDLAQADEPPQAKEVESSSESEEE